MVPKIFKTQPKLFICTDNRGCWGSGKTLEEAHSNYCHHGDFDNSIDNISGLTFYEAKGPLKVRLSVLTDDEEE